LSAREETPFPLPSSSDKEFVGRRFEDERHDGENFNGITFEFCTFEKIGLRNTVFSHCIFKHCEFLDCYFVGGRYEHCNFIGSYFERCNFTWAEFPNSQLDYTRFSQCAPVLQQVMEHKPQDPQAAAKFFRNLAFEHKNLGNWQEVDRLIHQSYKERERHYWNALTGANKHYLERYGSRKVRYGVRYVLSRLSRSLWGYGVSWVAFTKSSLFVGLVLLPLVNAVFGNLDHRSEYFWPGSPRGLSR
jgi:hypothetical protein